jgi:hypothetical protein
MAKFPEFLLNFKLGTNVAKRPITMTKARWTVSSLVFTLLSSLSSTALAKPQADANGSSTAPAALPAPTPAAPATAAAAAPAPQRIAITATCSLGDHFGIEEGEARTAADLVCNELARKRVSGGEHEVRLGKLGAKTLVVLATRSGQTYDERRVLLEGLDELTVAGPRLVAALSEGRSLDETRNVDTVLSQEIQAPKTKRGTLAFYGGFHGLTPVGRETGVSAGVQAAILYRAGSLGLSLEGRATGIGSASTKTSGASLDAGARYYVLDTDVTPFLGAGLGISHTNLDRDRGRGDLSGSGLAGNAQIGVEALRTQRVGLNVAVRADLPFYELDGGTRYGLLSTGTYGQIPDETGYAVPISLNVGLIFR